MCQRRIWEPAIHIDVRAPLAVMVAIGMICSASAALADNQVTYENAADLGKLCAAKVGSGEYGMCFSYVGAVLELVANGRVTGRAICVPPLTTIGKAVDVAATWFSDHQSRAMEPASLAIIDALADAFPCKR